jgi:hypothetical protein
MRPIDDLLLDDRVALVAKVARQREDAAGVLAYLAGANVEAGDVAGSAVGSGD